ncbi:DUF3891 family protein [Virgibacillus oceani]|uniref:Serine hydroxymethyltransferase n=1 Tax=Virgibacillus oceani TaxID=1479511 RepID=A0A917HI84_9BACI|nr:DUF3891 family protein [Virgibacillus oceani]GGG80349.1 serine hydroxymethyltransferase [Virgibacillus oceani]
MIIRERQNGFVMIEQDNHAAISGQLITNWKDSLFEGHEFRKSVEYAIYKHDCGWVPFDKEPFWNDYQQAPYSFVDFPTLPKLVFYKNGIDEVEYADTYAALLSSNHYMQFLLHDNSPEGQKFVQQEKDRQKKIIHTLTNFDQSLFEFHYGLLKLCDNVSLYICLNEPESSTETTHHFFKDGVPIPSTLPIYDDYNLKLHWKDAGTIEMSKFPFKAPITIRLKQKILTKDIITRYGLLKSYQNSHFQEIKIRLVPAE